MAKHKSTIEKRVKDISNRSIDTIGFQQTPNLLKLDKRVSSPPTYSTNIPNCKKAASPTNSPMPKSPNNLPQRTNSTRPKTAPVNSLNVDPKLANLILNDVLIDKPTVNWDDISGLEQVKATLRETVILPALKPELFTGLRTPPRGILLFGPPGTGKTLLAKALAFEAKCTFFSISASSLMSKFMGESEKLVRTLFQLAKELSPSIIFIDEIDSILKGRTDSEHEGSRRLKTEFLLQFDGVGSQSDTKRVLVMGATNRPQELDEAARRRFVKRVYIPLPDSETRLQLINKSLKGTLHSLTDAQINQLVDSTEGYSGSDLTALIKDAAMGPLRQLGDGGTFLNATVDSIPPITYADFDKSLKIIRKSVGPESLEEYSNWNNEFGSAGL
jgi:spastin